MLFPQTVAFKMFLVDFGGFFRVALHVVYSSFLFLHRSSIDDTPCIFQRCLSHYTFHLLNLFEKGVNMRNREVSQLCKQLILGFLEISMFFKNDKKQKSIKYIPFLLFGLPLFIFIKSDSSENLRFLTSRKQFMFYFGNKDSKQEEEEAIALHKIVSRGKRVFNGWRALITSTIKQKVFISVRQEAIYLFTLIFN